MSNQDVLWRQEGNSWYSRNRDALTYDHTGYAEPFMLLLWDYVDTPPRFMADVGCSTGWRVAQLAKKFRDCPAVGIDISSEAIAEGRRLYPHIALYEAPATELPLADGVVDLLLCSFLLHCLSRESLLRAVSEIDRVLAPGGLLVLNDFSPDVPSKTPWHHRPGIWTFKLPGAGAGMFLATGCYREVARLTYDHGSHRLQAATESYGRAAVTLLRKEEGYKEVPHANSAD